VDHQVLAIREMPETFPRASSRAPSHVVVEDDLLDAAKPGDRVAIYGLHKAAPSHARHGEHVGDVQVSSTACFCILCFYILCSCSLRLRSLSSGLLLRGGGAAAFLCPPSFSCKMRTKDAGRAEG